MGKLLEILVTIPALVLGLVLILKPLAISDLLGKAYWEMSRFTAPGKSEKTRKYFFGKNPFWFRFLGSILLFIWLLSFVGMWIHS